MSKQGLSEQDILNIIKARGKIGRHRFKWSNSNINKKLRRMVREGKIIKLPISTKEFNYYGVQDGK